MKEIQSACNMFASASAHVCVCVCVCVRAGVRVLHVQCNYENLHFLPTIHKHTLIGEITLLSVSNSLCMHRHTHTLCTSGTAAQTRACQLRATARAPSPKPAFGGEMVAVAQSGGLLPLPLRLRQDKRGKNNQAISLSKNFFL